jgi:hypothetical protein
VPVHRGTDNDLVASVGVSVPARRFTAERSTLIGVIREIAAEASAELGSAAADVQAPSRRAIPPSV